MKKILALTLTLMIILSSFSIVNASQISSDVNNDLLFQKLENDAKEKLTPEQVKRIEEIQEKCDELFPEQRLKFIQNKKKLQNKILKGESLDSMKIDSKPIETITKKDGNDIYTLETYRDGSNFLHGIEGGTPTSGSTYYSWEDRNAFTKMNPWLITGFLFETALSYTINMGANNYDVIDSNVPTSMVACFDTLNPIQRYNETSSRYACFRWTFDGRVGYDTQGNMETWPVRFSIYVGNDGAYTESVPNI